MMVDSFKDLLEKTKLPRLVILQGNHDATETTSPFFKFLSELHINKGKTTIEFISEPTLIGNEFFIPYQKDVSLVLSAINNTEGIKTIYMHQPMLGAISQSNYTLEKGINPNAFPSDVYVYSGDIHKPQKITDTVEYVGAPYQIYFGDNYSGQLILINDKLSHKEYLTTKFISKRFIEINCIADLCSVYFNKGDKVKVKYNINKEDYYLWSDIKQEIKTYLETREVELVTLTAVALKTNEALKIKNKKIILEQPMQILQRFGKHEQLNDEYIKLGGELIR